MRNLAFVLFALAAYPGRSDGQDITPAECNAEVAALQSRTADMRGWERISECGSLSGPAIAAALRDARTSTDSIYLKNLITAGARIREPNVFQAALALSDDQGATVPARVVGLVVLLAQYNVRLTLFPRPWQSLVTVPLSAVCGINVFSSNSYASEVPLPPGAFYDIASHTDALAANPAVPAVIRSLAGCVRQKVAATVPETVDPALITFEYVCGTKYRIRNGGTKWIDVTYQVYHVSEHGDLSVAPAGTATFETDTPYAVALFYQGQAIRDANNLQTACPS